MTAKHPPTGRQPRFLTGAVLTRRGRREDILHYDNR